MTLKRAIAGGLLTALLVLSNGSLAETYVFPVGPASPTETDISMTDAISIAKKELVLRQSIPSNDFQNYKIKANCVQLENSEKAWVVMLDEQSCGSDALVTISSADATIIDYQAGHAEITTFLIDQWTKKKGAKRTWSLEDKALYNWLFGSSDQYLIPNEDHISKDTAIDIALSAIPPSLISPEVSTTFNLLSYTDGRPEQYVWMVTILENGQEKFLVHVSALDGAVVEVFELGKNG
ncbi:MAG: PepSY domain-containing protein [Clostridia bacterium]